MNDDMLNDIWSLYFHDPNNDDWTSQSYIRISNISSIRDFWDNTFLLKKRIEKGMFFLMREFVSPYWDASENINGGCLSIKILKENMYEFWEDLSIKLLGETLVKEQFRDKYWNTINGISTSPKKNFCIVKIWIANQEIQSKEYFDLKETYYGDIIYKLNKDNIITNQLRVNNG